MTILRSRYPDIEVPSVPLSAFVLERAASLGNKPALVDGPSGRTLDYRDLVDGVQRLGAGLALRGIGKGDVVALFAPNMPEWVQVFHAVTSIGAVVTTINSLATVVDLTNQLRDAHARLLVTVPAFLDRALPAAHSAKLAEVVTIGDSESATSLASLATTNGAPPDRDIAPDDLAVLPYSSGTTGLPKGVRLSHRNLVANILQLGTLQDVREDETLIGVLPFFHIYGMTAIMNLGLRRGATIVTMPRFELGLFLDLMERHRVTRAFLVPPIVLALAKHPAVADRDLSSLRIILSGAAPLDARLAEGCATRLGCLVVQGYGLTESSPVTHADSDRPGEAKPGAIGGLVPSTEARIIDPLTGEDVGTGLDGELWVRGPQVMAGYLHDPVATAATVDADGWLHTGDISHADDDGHFFIVDRLKELIKVKGFQVPPAELEAILLEHPAVVDAAVIPVPDEVAGELPKAFVVLRDQVDPQQLIKFVAARAAAYKRIHQVEVVDAIPRSPSGKILRRVLVDRERARLAAARD